MTARKPPQASQSAQPVRHAETALYRPVEAFLEEQGFEVKGEICGCDVVAVRGSEAPMLIIAELKLSFTLELVLQAVDRLRCADLIYLAVVSSRKGRDRDARALRLCRLLGVGLLAVDPKLRTVSLLVEPSSYRPRPDLQRRARILKEHKNRQGDPQKEDPRGAPS